MIDIIGELLTYIETRYKRVYNSTMTLDVDVDTDNDNGGYTSYNLYINLNNLNKPLCIGGQFNSDSDFLTYLKSEFDKRNLYKTIYFVLKMVDPIDLETANK
jgi:formylmethanofuran dehydrogenase subunit E-like metal-binding protein